MKKIVIALSILAFVNIAHAQYNPYNGITVAGGNGIGDSAQQLGSVDDIFVDGSGNIFVVDGANDLIQEFVAGSLTDTAIILAGIIDSSNSASNVLSGPSAFYLDSSGNIYVVDEGNNRIQKFAPGSTSGSDGITVAGGNGPGDSLDQLDEPTSIYVDPAGNIYVADAYNNRVLKFPPGSTSATNGVIVAGGNSGLGNSAANQLNNPLGVFVDTAGYLYVSDAINNRVQKFPPGSDTTTNAVTVAGGNDTGAATNQLFSPGGIFVDHFGNLFVADINNNRVLEFPPGSTSATNGTIVAGIDGGGNGPGQLSGPSAVFLDKDLNMYVADNNNFRIQKFYYGETGIAKVPQQDITLDVSPDPFAENTTLVVTLPAAQNVTIRIFNAIGQQVEAHETQFAAGRNTLTVASNLAAGTYFLKLTSGTFSKTVKIIAAGE